MSLATIQVATIRLWELRREAPLRELHFGAGVFESSLEKGEGVTIRKGWRDFEPEGLVEAVCAEGDRFLIKITSCGHWRLSNVPLEDLLDDGFADRNQALDALGHFYPDLEMLSAVSSIRFKVIARIAGEEGDG